MSSGANTIVDEMRLQLWLKGQPIEVAQAIAIRSAMRVLPLVLKIHDVKSDQVSPEIRFSLTLQAFRANLINAVTLEYMSASFKGSSSAASKLVFAATNAIAASGDFSDNDNSARASTFSACRATVFAATAVADDNSAIRMLRFVVGSSEAAIKASKLGHADLVFECIRNDARAIEAGYDLKQMPLWLSLSDDGQVNSSVPKWVDPILERTAQHPEFSSDAGSWRLWLDWYNAQLENPPRSFLGVTADRAIASQYVEFWHGRAQEAMDRVTALVKETTS